MQCEPWPLDESCLPDGWDVDDEVVEHFRLLASEILHGLSGRTVGVCRYAVRPCRSDMGDPCSGPCSCEPFCSVTVGKGQVQCVEAVRINGVYIPRSGWRAYSNGMVVLTDGRCFPACQDLSLAPSMPGTWEITYLEGTPVTPLASRAVTALVQEMVSECAAECGVPRRDLTQTNVEGQTYTFADRKQFGASLPAVDDWLDTVNPYRSARQAAFFSPQHQPHWREI